MDVSEDFEENLENVENTGVDVSSQNIENEILGYAESLDDLDDSENDKNRRMASSIQGISM